MILEYPFAVPTFTVPFIPYRRPFPFPCRISPFCFDVMNVEAHEDDLSEEEIDVLTFEPQIAWGEMGDTRFQVISSSGFGVDECEDWEDEAQEVRPGHRLGRLPCSQSGQEPGRRGRNGHRRAEREHAGPRRLSGSADPLDRGRNRKDIILK